MKKLFIVRHGSYCENRLDFLGIRQIENLALRLKNLIATLLDVRIFTSNSGRATESAAIIGTQLGKSPEEKDFLFSFGDYGPNAPQTEKVLGLIMENQDADVLILVTHLEYTELLPSAFGREFLKISDFPYREISKGAAWFIDCEKNTIEELPAQI